MVKRRRSANETITTVVDGTVLIEPVESVESQGLAHLQTVLEETLASGQISGYILRTPTKAFVNLKCPDDLLEYAMLSSQAFETSTQISELLQLGETENIIIDGKTAKVLCIELGTSTLSMFMKKTADHSDVLSKILP